MLYHILSYEKSDLLKIDNIGFSEDPGICHFGPGQRELFLIHYVISGEGFFNGTHMMKGQGFLITPHSHEHYYPVEEKPWKLLWVTSRDPHIAEIFPGYHADPKSGIFTYDHIAAAEELTQRIRKDHNKVYSASEILEIFLNLFNRHKQQKEEKNMVDIYYRYAIDYISLNIFRPIQVADLTSTLGVSQPYLYHIFKTKCGISPKNKIDEMKIEKAMQMLKTVGMSVADVAYSLGFYTPQDFSKFFKKKIGCPPSFFKT